MITIQKDPNKEFTVLNLTDTQLVRADWIDDSINKNVLYATVRTLVKRVSPDLITISGDIADLGEKEVYEHFADLMDSFGIPWAPIWGNHDNEYGQKHLDEIADMFLSYKNIVFEKGDPSLGMGNYVINIEENGISSFAIFMLDTHDKIKIEKEDGSVKKVYAKITPEQLKWYEDMVNDLTCSGCNETAIIMHIPCFAYREIFDKAWSKDADVANLSGRDFQRTDVWTEDFKRCSIGMKLMPVYSYPAEDGVFETVKRLGSTKTILAGHDHYNNCITTWEGIKIGYALKTGTGSMRQRELNGGTVLKISKGAVQRIYHEHIDVSDFFAELERKHREANGIK